MRKCLVLFLWLSARAFASDNDTLPGLKTSGAVKNPATIVLRCGASNTVTGQPLYVVDGVPYDSIEMDKINPNSILHIEILKTSLASVLYGYRAMNGAIIITTKRSEYLVIQDADTKNLLERATVKVLPNKHRKQALLIADKNGEVDVSLLEVTNEYTMEISCIGYKTKTIRFSREKLDQPVKMEKAYKKLDTLVLIASTGYRGCKLRCRCSGVRVTRAGQPEPSKPAPSFSIYPNPVRSPGTVTLNLFQTFAGKVEIINASGQRIQLVNISEKCTNPVIHLNSIPPGSYFIQVSDSKSEKTFTQKLMVQ